jgi:hypothetical protein
MSSAYAHEEPRQSLIADRSEDVSRLNQLLESVSGVGASHGLKLPESIRLEPKDRPILLAAIQRRAGYSLAGDGRYFDHLYGRRIEGGVVTMVRSVGKSYSFLRSEDSCLDTRTRR